MPKRSGHLRWKKPISWWSDGEWCGRKGTQEGTQVRQALFPRVDPETRKSPGYGGLLIPQTCGRRDLDTFANITTLLYFFMLISCIK
ncbi:hypothetical protein CDAR_563141 [Caerostris darwini]|uniref:Uncharacterized protein n=1 Tax=Caerostris darwini TaxID=1538125 RepID=A0AAV4N6M7_9ARAC|nr:hypothetical protein CDAR_563141 [Caerostris darwini]